jgi:hypothetical protein
MITSPCDTPVTMPDEFTEAIELLLLLHEPPCVPSVLSEMIVPTHTVDGPLTVPAVPAAFTVITA